MIIKNPQFEISAVNPKQYPQNNLPQIVLVGKSNVGKSSFINTMVNRKKLAKLIFIIWIIDFILLIYLGMDLVKCLNKSKQK